MQLRRTMRPLSVGLFALLLGCSGSVSNRGSSNQDDSGGSGQNGNGGGQSGGQTSSGGGGSSVSSGTDPGTVALHRLSRIEYNNTVHDLLGTSLRPADAFTFVDTTGYGFGNNANALALGSAELTGFSAAAAQLANDAITNPAVKPNVLTCDVTTGDTCVNSILSALAKRAYRRPVQPTEVSNLLALVKVATSNGDSVATGVGLAIQAILTSPNFLFRVEIDPSPTSTTPHQISSYEMASRLSYFLWATMPDSTLFTAADADKLQSASDVSTQVDRMLKDSKASALLDSFGDYWTMNLQFKTHIVDTTAFPAFSEDLRTTMIGETRAILSDLFSGAIGFNQFMYGNYTYANDALAAVYGLPKPGSTSLTKINTPDGSHRGSFLTNSSFLAATSQDSITSVVQRGKYVLFNMMCGQVGNPPPGVPPLAMSMGNTQRDRFAAHEATPACAACHKFLDPPGLTLEQYDALGQYRTKDGNYPINAQENLILPDGSTQSVSDAMALAKYISTSDGYAQCVSQALFAYALGRGAATSDGGGDMDSKAVSDMQGNLTGSGWKFAGVVKQLVSSDPFRMRRSNQGAN